jgi:hypothetical protein
MFLDPSYGLGVTDGAPATPDNIAMAEDDSIPAGYTKVDTALPAVKSTNQAQR